ncbi:hypothetical protein [Chryseosolibacter indicus]|uniref:Uncharacterized protein n=1 Tax=Chryseosolibacter indicus TaxID=2782351 RepID=A0ABS5VRI9_9BACT|nr:hypothetical protein [Chryseosolibacter indicus]MBT1704064.1 hypothetical protein [Chryseosolibacter indicus]
MYGILDTDIKVITDNLIIIKGGAYNDIKKALRQWIQLYLKDLQDGLTFELYKNGRGSHIIQADRRLDNERFYYLINYLNYPENINYRIEIEGFTIGKANNVLKDKQLLVYFSSIDKESDSVFVTTSENENFRIDFNGKITDTREKRIFQVPAELNLDNPETINVSQKQISRNTIKTNETCADKRFNVLLLIVVSLFTIGIIIKQIDNHTFAKYSLFYGMGIGLWFFGDYKLLQSDKHYIYCLIIAICYLVVAIVFVGGFNKHILDYGALHPIAVLLIQKPTRFLYKLVFNREPVVDRPPPSFWDVVYIGVLFLALTVLPFLIIHGLVK